MSYPAPAQSATAPTRTSLARNSHAIPTKRCTWNILFHFVKLANYISSTSRFEVVIVFNLLNYLLGILDWLTWATSWLRSKRSLIRWIQCLWNRNTLLGTRWHIRRDFAQHATGTRYAPVVIWAGSSWCQMAARSTYSGTRSGTTSLQLYGSGRFARRGCRT